MDSAAPAVGDFSPLAEDSDALNDAMDTQSDLYSHDKQAPSDSGRKRVRVVSNDLLMSKLACTLLVNMNTFGESCMKKGDKNRTKSLMKLCELLNADPEIQSSCSHVELKLDTVRQWINRDSSLIADAGFEAQNKADKHVGEKVHGGPSKVQQDWMETYSRFRAISSTEEESIGKESKGKLKLKSTTAAEAMFFAASKACGAAARETAIHDVKDKRDAAPSGLSSPGSYHLETEDDESPTKSKDEWKRPRNAEKQEDKMQKFFTTIESVLVTHMSSSAVLDQANADEAAAKKLEGESPRN
jgi:hypothetical protein